MQFVQRRDWRASSTHVRDIEEKMKIRNEIDNLNTAFGSMAADLKSHQARLMAIAGSLETLLAGRIDEPTLERLRHGAATFEVSLFCLNVKCLCRT